MNRSRGMRRAAALGLALTLALLVCVPVLADTVAEHAQEQPIERPPAEAAEPEKQPYAAPTDAARPEPRAEADGAGRAHTYGASWSGGAFAGQTVNYTDELVIGKGACHSLRPARDIVLIRDGKPVEKLKGASVSYDTSDASVLAVGENGRIMGVKKGSAQLIVTVSLPGGQKQLRKNVKVTDAPRIKFAPDYAILADGAKLDLSQHAKAPFLKASPNVDANVSYKITAVDKSHGSKVSLDADSGMLAVRFNRPGDVYKVTAKGYGGERASFMVYLGRRADRVEILVSPEALNASGALMMKPGESRALKAAAYAGAALAARQDVRWQLVGGGGLCSIDQQGLLVLAGNAAGSFCVEAYAEDGSGVSARIDVVVAP